VIVDTPGFGDTQGIKRDGVIAEQMKHFFSMGDMHRIDQLDCIGFVAQATD
jgi:predicted GTPase